VVRIKFVGPLPKGRCLRSSLFIMRLFLPLALPFFWKCIWRNKAPESSVVCLDNNFREDFNFG
jgi:hypothetical protein